MKKSKDLNHSIENEDCAQIRKQTRKKITEIKKFKKKFDDYSERKINMKNKNRFLKIEIVFLKLI